MLRTVCAVVAFIVAATDVNATRLKDIVSIGGVRENQLVGYGLVMGLNGTGDSLRNAPFTQQSLQAMLETLGVNVQDTNARTKNAAAVIVTANLPALSGEGSRIDVSVASVGDATSLQGGTLVMTQLRGVDGEVYALAQGPIAISGFSARGQTESLTRGVPTSGRVPGGAMIERSVPGNLADMDTIVLELRNPDFATASRVAHAINRFSKSLLKRALAREQDMRAVIVERPAGMPISRFIAAIGELNVEVDAPSRVVIDEKTGTVVIGSNVRIGKVAVSQGSLTVRVSEDLEVSQPNPFTDGETVIVPKTTVRTKEEQGKLAIVDGASLDRLVQTLNAIGLKPGDLIAILQAIKSAGALQAELVLQ